jgi:uncharacterized protein with von Willebrand factor type A (vWA) domain
MMLFRNLLHFGRLLRAAGLDVPTARLHDAVVALDHVDVRQRRDVRCALRTLFVHRADEIPLFDAAFDLFWRATRRPSSGVTLRRFGERNTDRRATADAGAARHTADSGAAAPPQGSSTPSGLAIYSDAEALRTKDFAQFTDDERARARVLLQALRWEPGARVTRRWTAGARGVPDLRRVIRRNLHRGGELLELPRRRRKSKPRGLVLLCDVSGSMERYSRMLLQFIHVVARRYRSVEAFLFATRLTRVTAHLGDRRLDAAVTAIARTVPDWSGGTRIGESIETFNRRWARRVLGRGPIVLLISDGWDRGDPGLLREEMARLQRSCHRLIWLNPLLGSATYQPLTRGIQAALPFVDDFLPVHNLVSLEQLGAHLSTLGDRVRRSVVSYG